MLSVFDREDARIGIKKSPTAWSRLLKTSRMGDTRLAAQHVPRDHTICLGLQKARPGLQKARLTKGQAYRLYDIKGQAYRLYDIEGQAIASTKAYSAPTLAGPKPIPYR